MSEFEHRTVEVNGLNLHTVQAGPLDGPLVILLHGFPEFWYGWRKQIEFLAGQGYRVIAPDQRGYNLSEKPPASKTTGSTCWPPMSLASSPEPDGNGRSWSAMIGGRR